MSNAGSTLIDAANAAYTAMAQFYASDWYVIQARNEGYFVYSGCAVTASGTAGKVDLSAGVILAGTTEVNITAITAFATTITSIADATNPKWVGVELDPTAPTAAVTFNQGTAAANPQKPTPTSARVVVAWLYVPANATAVDALTSTANGKAKIIEARQLVTVHSSRKFHADTSLTSLSNPTTLTTLLAAAPTIPANSLSVGDIFDITFSTLSTFNVTDSAVEHALGFFAGSQFFVDWTTDLLTKAANARRASCRLRATCSAIGASANFVIDVMAFMGVSNASATPSLSLGGAANGSGIATAQSMTATFDSTVAQTLDLKARLTVTNAASTVVLRSFSVVKTPA